jgi:gas vesicle protein
MLFKNDKQLEAENEMLKKKYHGKSFKKFMIGTGFGALMVALGSKLIKSKPAKKTKKELHKFNKKFMKSLDKTVDDLKETAENVADEIEKALPDKKG